MTIRHLWCLALLAILLAPQAAPASEFYYVMVFASQRPLGRARHTHSFATFVRATGEGATPNPATIQSWTISWMPRSLHLAVYRLRPEPGANLDLTATLHWAQADGQQISMWGPYQIRKELFDAALCQVTHLQSGAVCYKIVDTGYPTECVSNCIHAVSDVALNTLRLRIGWPGWGNSASFFIVQAFRPWLLDPCHTHDWVAAQVGLAGYPLVRRDPDQNPTRNVVLRTLQSAAKISLQSGWRN